MGVAALLRVFDSLSVFCVVTANVRLLVFVPSVSENISCVGFLKEKTSRKQELALRHLVNMLVPENL